MLLLSLCSLALGLLVPVLCGIFDSWAWSGYENLGIGYWAWIASLALVAAGWGSVVWYQRQRRYAGFNAMTTTTQPRSGESRADDKHGG